MEFVLGFTRGAFGNPVAARDWNRSFKGRCFKFFTLGVFLVGCRDYGFV